MRIMLAILLLGFVAHSALGESIEQPSFQIVAKPATTDDKDVELAIEVTNNGPQPQTIYYGGIQQVFGIYILGPWGWISDGKQWMNQQVAQGREIEILSGKSWVVHCRLSEFFPIEELRRGGKFQVNVKFFYKKAGMSEPVDSGPVDFGK